jgi:hypothetical protein
VSNEHRAVSLLWLLGLVLCSSAAAPAQTPDSYGKDLVALLTHMQANQSTNRKLAQQYTSDELWHNVNFDKNGKVTVDESAKFENVYVEELPYRRKVEANGKPLSGKEAAAEEKRYEQTVEQRRKMSLEDKRRGLHMSFHFSVSLPTCCLLTLFDNRMVRHETLDGRDTAVIESVPKANAKPAKANEKSALNWKQTTWIDVQDAMIARFEAEKLNEEGHVAKGSIMRLDFIRLVDVPASTAKPESTVWLQRNYLAHVRVKMLWFIIPGTTEQTWSNFKKFHVDMRLLEGTVEETTDHEDSQEQSPTPR